MQYTGPNASDTYMEIRVLSTLAYENKKEKKGNPLNHDPDKQTYIARDMPLYKTALTLKAICNTTLHREK